MIFGKKKKKAGDGAENRGKKPESAEPKKELTEPERYQALRKEYRSRWTDLLIRIGTFAAVVVILFTAIFGVAEVKDNDMYPALKEGDVVLYYRHADFTNTDAVLYEYQGETYAGRIEATGGSTIGLTGDRQITIDGRYQPVDTDRGTFFKTKVTKANAKGYPYQLAADEYYILGDRRSEANDSRSFGAIKKTQIKGKIITVLRRRNI